MKNTFFENFLLFCIFCSEVNSTKTDDVFPTGIYLLKVNTRARC